METVVATAFELRYGSDGGDVKRKLYSSAISATVDGGRLHKLIGPCQLFALTDGADVLLHSWKGE